jgi:hypothetical protein
MILFTMRTACLALLIHTVCSQDTDSVEEATDSSQPPLSLLPPSNSENDQKHRDNVKQVLEDFQLSILESESLHLSSSAELGAGNFTEQQQNATEPAAAARPKLNCLPTTHVAEGEARVVLVNGTELQARLAEESSPAVANRTFPANCSLTLFYASWCQFRQVLQAVMFSGL